MRAVEPYAEPHHVPAGVTVVGVTEHQVRQADAVVVVTDHDCLDHDLVVRHVRYVFDTRNPCHGPAVERL